MDKIRFSCACGRRLVAPVAVAGKRARCPACKKVLQVPPPLPGERPGVPAEPPPVPSPSAVRTPAPKSGSPLLRVGLPVVVVGLGVVGVLLYFARNPSDSSPGKTGVAGGGSGAPRDYVEVPPGEIAKLWNAGGNKGSRPAASSRAPATSPADVSQAIDAVDAVTLLARGSSLANPVEYDEGTVHQLYARLRKELQEYQEDATSQLTTLLSRMRDTDRVRIGYSRGRDTSRYFRSGRGSFPSRSGFPSRPGGPSVPGFPTGRGPVTRGEVIPDCIRMLMLAPDATDFKFTVEAIRTARRLGEDSREFEAPLVGLAERMGPFSQTVALKKHYSEPFLNLRAAVLRMEWYGIPTEELNLLTRMLRGVTEPDALACANLAEVFDYLGAHDLAMGFWWKALEAHAREATERYSMTTTFLYFNREATPDVAVIPRDVNGVDMLNKCTNPVKGSTVLRTFKAGRSKEALEWSRRFLAPMGDKWRIDRQRQKGDALADVRCAEFLVGLGQSFMRRGYLRWAESIACRALLLCEGKEYDDLAGWLAASPARTRIGGRTAVFALPSDRFRVAAEALHLLGEADLLMVMARAGREFPVRAAVDSSCRPVLQRARNRLTEAYRLALLSRAKLIAERCAYCLVCLDVLEETSGNCGKETYAQLLSELEEEVLGPAGRCHRFLGDVPKDRVGSRPESVRLRESAFCLAAQLALLAGDKTGGKKYSDETAKGWAMVFSGVQGETFRLSFAGRRQRHYRQLVALLVEAGLEREALEWTERLRGQALLEVIGQGPKREAFADVRNAVAAGIQQCQVLQTVLQIDSRHVAGVEGVLTDRGRERPAIVDLEKLRETLPPDACILDYFLHARGGVVWVITRDGARPVRLKADRERVRKLVLRWRTNLFPEKARGVGGVRPTDRPPAYDPNSDPTTRALYDLLLKPVEPVAGRYRHWCIVPDGSLKALSFAALGDGRRTCYQKHAVSYATSLTVLAHTFPGRPKRLNHVLCLGNPAVGKPGYALPMAEDEVNKVARLFPSSQVFTGREAHPENLISSAVKADVLHVACHAVAVDKYGNRALWLSPVGKRSGYVQYFDLYQLRTPAFLACLSACSTGLGEEVAGDEVLGLSRGFLAAGVPSMVISLWDVPDKSTADLMGEFYRQLPKADLASALQEAQRKIAAEYPAPWHWAAFVVYGAWAPPEPGTAAAETDTPADGDPKQADPSRAARPVIPRGRPTGAGPGTSVNPRARAREAYLKARQQNADRPSRQPDGARPPRPRRPPPIRTPGRLPDSPRVRRRTARPTVQPETQEHGR